MPDPFVSRVKANGSGEPLKNSNEPSDRRTAAAPQDINSWPFIERRRTDRRQQDRRRPAAQSEPPAWYGAHECTDRERQIIDLLLQGMTNKQIAKTLGIAEDTVKKHLQHVYKKLGVRRRALLIADHASAR